MQNPLPLGSSVQHARHSSFREQLLQIAFKLLPIKHGKHRLLDRFFRLPNRVQADYVSYNFAGNELVVDASDLVGWHMHILKGFDPAVCEALAEHSKQLDELVFWDIGANKGAASYEIAVRFPYAKLVLIEPQGEMQAALKKNMSLVAHGRHEIFKVALGNSPEVRTIYIPLNNRGAASLRKAIDPTGMETESVTVETADAIVSRSEFGWPNIVKIDVEGFELSVIESLVPALQSKRIRALVFECHQDRTDDFRRIVSLAMAFEYSLYAIKKSWSKTKYEACQHLVTGCSDYLLVSKLGA